MAARGGAAVVAVDAFRSSTTIAALVSKGVRVVPVASIEEAASYPGAAYRIGERGSAKVQGFDFGNSPTEIEKVELEKGATVVLSTTNGTRIIEAARDAPAILTGAFVNAHAIADELTRGIYGASQALIGCGWEALRRNSPARRLKRLGYEEDLDFCLAEDTVPVVPRLKGGAFVGQG